MPLPLKLKKYYEKDAVELTLEDVIKNSDGMPGIAQSNRVKTVAQVQARLDQYRGGAKNMSEDQLKTESHDSKRLGEFLNALVQTRPPRCHPHAIISGRHTGAIDLRIILAACGMRIDDLYNGVWLPIGTNDCPHPSFPKAPPHSRIHRKAYYLWLASKINKASCQNIAQLRFHLRHAAQMLHEHTFPENILTLKEKK